MTVIGLLVQPGTTYIQGKISSGENEDRLHLREEEEEKDVRPQKNIKC